MKPDSIRKIIPKVSVEEADCIVYSTDASQVRKRAEVVAWPTDTSQLRKLVHYALRSKINIIPRGAGTGLAGACVPSKDSVILDMSMMNRVLSLDIDAKTVTVQPGIVIEDLNRKLDRYDLFFPVIPSSHKVCQVGASLATNASGNRAIRFGNMADWVEEVKMVDGAGKELTIKDPKEIAGSEGLLGIITELKLKLTEVIQNTSLSIESFTDIDNFVARVLKVRMDADVLALEFLDRLSSHMCSMKPEYNLFIEYSTEEGNLKDPEKIDEVWRIREGLGPVLSAKRYSIMEDPWIPENNYSKFIRWLNNNKVPVFGHIGTGIFHPRFKPDQGKLIRQMYEYVRKLDGRVSGEHGIGIRKKDYVPRGDKERLKKLKDKYDPEGIFNVGKVI